MILYNNEFYFIGSYFGWSQSMHLLLPKISIQLTSLLKRVD